MKEIDSETLKRYIIAGQCPWCSNSKAFIVLAAHISQKHEITPYELREKAGLNRTTSICDPEHSEMCKQRNKNLPPEVLAKFILAGHNPEVINSIDHKLRPEGKVNTLKWLLSPEHLKQARENLSSEESIRKIGIAARNRLPELVSRQTERILQKHDEWLKTHTPEEISQNRKKAYQTWVQNTSQEHVDNHFRNMRKMIPHDAQVKGAKAAAEVIPLYHKNKEWKEKWKHNLMVAIQKRPTRTIPKSDYPIILKRHNEGVKTKIMASEYGVDRSFISWIIRKVKLHPI